MSCMFLLHYSYSSSLISLYNFLDKTIEDLIRKVLIFCKSPSLYERSWSVLKIFSLDNPINMDNFSKHCRYRNESWYMFKLFLETFSNMTVLTLRCFLRWIIPFEDYSIFLIDSRKYVFNYILFNWPIMNKHVR